MPAINDTATADNGQATGAAELASFMRIAQSEAAEHLGILGRIAIQGMSVAELLQEATRLTVTSDRDFARRLLDYAPASLMTAHFHSKRPAELYVLQTASGVWLNHDDTLQKMHHAAIDDWLQVLTFLTTHSALSGKQLGTCVSASRQNLSAQARRNVVAVVGAEAYAIQETNPDTQLTIADASDLDSNRAFLGAPNGIIDLNLGMKMRPELGRTKLVTRSVPDDFDDAANGPQNKVGEDALAKLFNHVPKEARDYLLDSVAFALRGSPKRTFLVIAGPKAGGKSTLLSAFKACLGDVKAGGYGMSIDASALLRANLKTSNAHAGGLFGIQDARLATVSELPEGKNALNTGLLKSITGGDDLPIRDVGEKAGISRPARGTLLLAMNDNDLSRLKLDDPALEDRCYILPYPSIPEGEQDKGFVDAVKETPEIRQAVLAELVMRATKFDDPSAEPPQPPQSVLDAVKLRRDDSIGESGQWAMAHLVVTDNPDDFTTSQHIWDAVSKVVEPDKDDRIDGRKRNEFTMMVQENCKLPLVTRGMVGEVGNRKRERGYLGVRLLGPGEAPPVDVAKPYLLPEAVQQQRDEGATRDEIVDRVDAVLLKGEARAGAPVVTARLTAIPAPLTTCKCPDCGCASPVEDFPPNAILCGLCAQGICPREKAKDGPLPGQTPLDLPTMGGKGN